jgi:hypothetical protein
MNQKAGTKLQPSVNREGSEYWLDSILGSILDSIQLGEFFNGHAWCRQLHSVTGVTSVLFRVAVVKCSGVPVPGGKQSRSRGRRQLET